MVKHPPSDPRDTKMGDIGWFLLVSVIHCIRQICIHGASVMERRVFRASTAFLP